MANIQLTNTAAEIDSALSYGYARLSQSFVGPTGSAGFTVRNNASSTGIYLGSNYFDFYSNTLNFNKANADTNINLYNGTNFNINSSTSNFKLCSNGTLYIGNSSDSCKGLQISNTNPVIILRDCDNSLNQSQAFKFIDSGYVDIFYICQQANTRTSIYSCTDLNFIRQSSQRLNLNSYGAGVNGGLATSTYPFVVSGCSQFLNGFNVPSTASCVEINTCVKFTSGISFLDCNFVKYVQTGFTGCFATTGYVNACLNNYVQTGNTGNFVTSGNINNYLINYAQNTNTGSFATTGYVNTCLNNYVLKTATGNLVTTGSLNTCLTTFYAQNVNTGSFATTGYVNNCLLNYVQTGSYLNIQPITNGIHQICGSGMNINLTNSLCLNTSRIHFTGSGFVATGSQFCIQNLIVSGGNINARSGVYSSFNCSSVYCFNQGVNQAGVSNFGCLVGWIDITVNGTVRRVPYF